MIWRPMVVELGTATTATLGLVGGSLSTNSWNRLMLLSEVLTELEKSQGNRAFGVQGDHLCLTGEIENPDYRQLFERA